MNTFQEYEQLETWLRKAHHSVMYLTLQEVCCRKIP